MTGFSQSFKTCHFCKRSFKSLGFANHYAACYRKEIDRQTQPKNIRRVDREVAK